MVTVEDYTTYLYILYAISSIGLTIFNKALAQHLPNSSWIVMIQNMASASILLSGRFFFRSPKKHIDGLIVSHDKDEEKSLKTFMKDQYIMKSFKIEHMRFILPMSLVFIFMLWSSLKSFKYVSVATVVVFRNVGTLALALLEIPFQKFVKLSKKRQKKKPSLIRWACLIMIIIGVIIYAYNDITGDYVGYAWISVNTMAVVINALLENFVSVHITQTSSGISAYLNISSSIILFVFNLFQHNLAIPEIGFLSLFLLMITCGLAPLMTFSNFSLNKLTSPTNIKLCNNMARIGSVLIGCVIFNNPLSFQAMVGLTICIFSGALYSIVQK